MSSVIKLGGSVITDKNRIETVDKARISGLADALANREDLVIVHGAGSFGHHHAATHGVSVTKGTHDPVAIREIHSSMERLNDIVVEALTAEGVPAVSVEPFSVGYRDRAGNLRFPLAQVETMLAEGFVPVTYGDVISHEKKGATIISGDELVVSLADGLAADRVGLCSAVPGVLDGAGEVIPEITSYDDVSSALGKSESTDVTGGMAAKVRALLELDVPASIFGPESLEGFLAGETVGTTIL